MSTPAGLPELERENAYLKRRNAELQEEDAFCLERIPGRASNAALMSALPEVSDAFKPRILAALGHRHGVPHAGRSQARPGTRGRHPHRRARCPAATADRGSTDEGAEEGSAGPFPRRSRDSGRCDGARRRPRLRRVDQKAAERVKEKDVAGRMTSRETGHGEHSPPMSRVPCFYGRFVPAIFPVVTLPPEYCAANVPLTSSP